MTESAVPTLNMDALLGSPDTNPEPQSSLEKALATVDHKEAVVENVEEAEFQFRSLLSEEQLSNLQKRAPEFSVKMVNDVTSIIEFGEPVLTKLNNTSVEILRQQKDIKLPEADVVVNDMLRAIDGYNEKFRAPKIEGAFSKLKSLFNGAVYSFKNMVREAQPIISRLDMAEMKIREMEMRLADGVVRGQKLHQINNESLEGVVGVLAALEEIMEVTKKEYEEINSLLGGRSSTDLGSVEYKGETLTFSELNDLHAVYANGLSELEKTWFDWRQQFFLGYASSPSIMNLIMVSATMQRRCQAFRTMGIPQARMALAQWQQAALAKEGADLGNSVQEGTNRLIQHAAKATAEAVTETAYASQAALITEDTVFAILDSVKAQCDGIVSAAEWGKNMRAKNLQVMEQSEAQINASTSEARQKVVAQTLEASRTPNDAAPLDEKDTLEILGIK